MAKPVGTRMDDEEFARHQSSPEWVARIRDGQKWFHSEERKINARHDKAVQAAQTRFYKALANAGVAKVKAYDELRDREDERTNRDITEVAIELGIWKR